MGRVIKEDVQVTYASVTMRTVNVDLRVDEEEGGSFLYGAHFQGAVRGPIVAAYRRSYTYRATHDRWCVFCF